MSDGNRDSQYGEQADVDEFEILAKSFSPTPSNKARNVREWGLPNQLDFPLYDAVARYAGWNVGSWWNRAATCR